MDIRKVRKLIELLQETGVGEIEIHEGEESVRISLHGQPTHAVAAQPSMIAAPTSTIGTPPSPPLPEPTVPAADASSAATKGHPLKSPMVGTVYLSAKPGSPPFVEIGQRVKAGDTLCIIEAMKMFNQIEADRSGVVSARMVDNEQPVEFEQTLFIIDDE